MNSYEERRKIPALFCADTAVVLPPFHTAQRVGAATARDTISSGGGFAGMDEAIKRLRPSHVVCYGGDIGYKFPCGVSYIANHNTERFGGKS